jgi:hypothetical protein
MQGSEFDGYLNHFPEFKHHFKGVFSIDTLPKYLGYRNFLICNTDVKSGNGKHWLCFFQTEKKIIEVFDSLGIDNNKKLLLSSNCKFKQELIFNTTPFQDINTSSCGSFVIYFVIERLFNLDLDFEEVLELILTADVLKNEKTVSDFIKDLTKNT